MLKNRIVWFRCYYCRKRLPGRRWMDMEVPEEGGVKHANEVCDKCYKDKQ